MMIYHSQQPMLITSIEAEGDLPAQRLVDFSGALATQGEPVLGVCQADTEDGQFAPIAVLGILAVEAGETIAIGDRVEADSDGRIIKRSTGQTVGVALDDGHEGDSLRILLRH